MYSQVSQLFNMGGYEGYVWSTYGLALGIIAGNFYAVHRKKRVIRKKLLQWLGQ